ncbi:MAG: PaaI family thioesterase [Acidimicrobiia bacterium]
MERSERIAAAIAADPYATAQGFRVVEVTDEDVIVEMTVRTDQVNFLGGTHGGVLHSLADCAFSLASNAYPEDAVAIDTHLAITGPTGIGTTLRATASEATRGKSLATYRVDVTRDDGRTVALFTGTVFVKQTEA